MSAEEYVKENAYARKKEQEHEPCKTGRGVLSFKEKYKNNEHAVYDRDD